MKTIIVQVEEMYKIEHVNTGCLYEKAGQKITIIHGRYATHFIDHSRMLDGTILTIGLSAMDVIEEYVKGVYDYCQLPYEAQLKFRNYSLEKFKDISAEYKTWIRRM